MDDTRVYEARLEVLDFLIEVFHDAPGEAFLERLRSEERRVGKECRL